MTTTEKFLKNAFAVNGIVKAEEEMVCGDKHWFTYRLTDEKRGTFFVAIGSYLIEGGE